MPKPKKPTNISMPESLSTDEESAIIKALRDEAYLFVPDKLDAIYAKLNLSYSLDAKDEKTLRKILMDEAIVHDDNLLEIKKSTATLNPIADKSLKAIDRRIHKEGQHAVPNVKGAVYQETGVALRSPFASWLKRNGATLAIVSTLLLACGIASSFAFAFGTNGSVTEEITFNTYANVSFTPATASQKGAETQQNALNSSSSTDTYTASWDITANENNVVTSLDPSNYSASLVDVSLKEKTEIASLLVTLVDASYANGYLSTISKEAYNTITMDFTSESADFEANYGDVLKMSLSAALEAKSIYADVSLNFQTAEKTSDNGEGASSKLLYLSSFVDVESIDLSLLEDEIVTQAVSASKAMSKAKLSDSSLSAFRSGLSRSIYGYLNHDTLPSPISEELYENSLKTIMAEASKLPWADAENHDTLQKSLANPAYYIFDSKAFFPDEENKIERLYGDIQNYVLYQATATTESYAEYLAAVEELAKEAKTTTGVTPSDPSAKLDEGGHEPGDGPKNDSDWGNGGVKYK